MSRGTAMSAPAVHVCLDTSAYGQFRRGDERAVEIVRRARRVSVPVIVLGELRAGFRLGARPHEHEEALEEFLADSVVDVMNVDGEASMHFADLYAELRRKKTPVPKNDIWTAALALRDGATVLTFDRHFEAIPRVGRIILD
jgi:tRNA(fMet)-specific endonuclease VapC